MPDELIKNAETPYSHYTIRGSAPNYEIIDSPTGEVVGNGERPIDIIRTVMDLPLELNPEVQMDVSFDEDCDFDPNERYVLDNLVKHSNFISRINKKVGELSEGLDKIIKK